MGSEGGGGGQTGSKYVQTSARGVRGMRESLVLAHGQPAYRQVF